MPTASTFSDLQTYVPQGGTVTLLNDIDMVGTITVPANISTTIDGAGFTLANLTSRHFNVTGDGTGTGNGASLTLENVVLDGNSTGGGIYIGGSPAGGTLIMNNGAVMQNCHSSGSSFFGGGSAIYGSEGSVTILNSGSIIQNNTSSGYGGAIFIGSTPNYISPTTLTINDGALITENAATGAAQGGAISTATGAVLTINGGTFTNNSGAAGGVINLSNYGNSSALPTLLYMVAGLMTGNEARTSNSGCIRVHGYSTTNSGSQAYISGGEFSNNTALSNGGAFAQVGYDDERLLPYLKISGSTLIANNTAGSLGGGILANGNLDIVGGTISNNRAQYGGGIGTMGIYTVNQMGGNIVNNSAAVGGGVYLT